MTAETGVVTAENGSCYGRKRTEVVTVENGVVTTYNGVMTAKNGVMTAKNGVMTAEKRGHDGRKWSHDGRNRSDKAKIGVITAENWELEFKTII